MFESLSLSNFQSYITRIINQIANLDSEMIFLVVLILTVVIVLDAVSSFTKKKNIETGIEAPKRTISIDGSTALPVRDYVSEIQGLAGRPDALISEGGFIIPVERKPLAKKIRDRYVAQLLVYMRLVEEFEGKKPPYGYLILGPSRRKVKVFNSDARQAWLQKLVDEMQAILQGKAEAVPGPDKRKCAKCDVNKFCSHSMSLENENDSSSGLKVLH